MSNSTSSSSLKPASGVKIICDESLSVSFVASLFMSTVAILCCASESSSLLIDILGRRRIGSWKWESSMLMTGSQISRSFVIAVAAVSGVEMD
jgi:hypothetical protein